MNLSTIAYTLQLLPKQLYAWYRHVISDFEKDKKEGRFSAHKVYDYVAETGEIKKEHPVHIFQPDNIGEKMCIDEKMISKKYSTIISNQKTGKIALLIDSVKPTLVKQAVELFEPEKLKGIKYMNADMSPVIKKICRDTIPNASMIIDKFHVIKHILEAINNERLKLKHKLKQAGTPTRGNLNGWSDLELIEKSRYLLYKMWYELDNDDQELLNAVFAKFSILGRAYRLVQQIRGWYDKNNIGKHRQLLLDELQQWITDARRSRIESFKLIIKMFNNHLDNILRYFEQGQTNAKAENLNGKIQRFIANNYGTRDREFFFYRVQLYFASAPQKKT